MKKRTKFTIVAMVMITLLGIYMVLCSAFGWDFPPDAFVTGWIVAWTTELAILFGIKLKSGGSEE